MPKFTKSELAISLGVIGGLYVAQKFIRPVIQGAL